jgi:Domain of Unknown Function (DUF1259)
MVRSLLTALLAATLIAADSPASLDTAAISAALGRSGAQMAGNVYRVAFPRTDLHVRVANKSISPALALGGYAAFIPETRGTLAVGDLVLLEPEIAPVMTSLEGSGFQITALHNHLRAESPHVMYMHFMAVGDAATLAKKLRDALATSSTPLGPLPTRVPAVLPFEPVIERTLGRKGLISGSVLSISAPRAEAITLDGMVVPPAAGVATAMNFEEVGAGNVAATGDFVLLGSEIAAVQSSLLANGFQITALHHHMIDESPHLYYMHFWVVGDPVKVASALRDALSHTNVLQ